MWDLSQGVRLDRKAEAESRAPSPGSWEDWQEDRGGPCTACPRWAAARSAAGAQWLGVGRHLVDIRGNAPSSCLLWRGTFLRLPEENGYLLCPCGGSTSWTTVLQPAV